MDRGKRKDRQIAARRHQEAKRVRATQQQYEGGLPAHGFIEPGPGYPLTRMEEAVYGVQFFRSPG